MDNSKKEPKITLKDWFYVSHSDPALSDADRKNLRDRLYMRGTYRSLRWLILLGILLYFFGIFIIWPFKNVYLWLVVILSPLFFIAKHIMGIIYFDPIILKQQHFLAKKKMTWFVWPTIFIFFLICLSLLIYAVIFIFDLIKSF